MRLARSVTGLSSPVNIFTDRFKAVLHLWFIYVYFVLFLLCFPARLFINVMWSPAGKGLTSWLSFVMSYCEVVTSIGILGQVWVLDCIDSRSLPSFLFTKFVQMGAQLIHE